MARKPPRILILGLALWGLARGAFPGGLAASPGLAKAILASPDLVVSSSYGLDASPALVAKLVGSPLVALQLWEVYRFSPRYRARPLADGGFHADDPTGIAGDVYPIPSPGSGPGIAYVAFGNIQHALAPPFKGRAALVFTPQASGAGTVLRLDLYLRMENRFLGFLAKTFTPLVRTLVLRRLGFNFADFNTIVKDVAASPEAVAQRLGGQAARDFLALVDPGR